MAELKHLPFDGIPRFPEEPPLEGVPTKAEESVFNDPLVVRAVELATEYTRPHTKRPQKESVIKQINNVPRSHQETFKSVVQMLKDSISDSTKYDELLGRLDELAINPTTDRLFDMSKFPLPESLKREFSKRAIELVNRSFEMAYPEAYGTIITPLQVSDIRVISDAQLSEHIKETGRGLTHSYIQKQEDKSSETSLFKVHPDYVVALQHKGRPILFSTSMLDELEKLPPTLNEALLAYLLIHEQLHRIVKPQVSGATTSHPLITFPFVEYLTARYEAKSSDEREKVHKELVDTFEFGLW